MISTFKDARRAIESELAAEGKAPTLRARRPASASIPLTRWPVPAPRQGGRTANRKVVRQQRAPILKQHDRASRHVRRTAQNSTTAATDRGAAQQASPPPSPPPSSSAEASPPDLSQTTPNGGCIISRLWRKFRGIDLEAMADNNPAGFLGILIALAQFVWQVIHDVVSWVIDGKSSSAGEAMQQARRGIEASWEKVRRRADNFARSVGLSLAARSFDRIHARQWDQPRQEKKDL